VQTRTGEGNNISSARSLANSSCSFSARLPEEGRSTFNNPESQDQSHGRLIAGQQSRQFPFCLFVYWAGLVAFYYRFVEGCPWLCLPWLISQTVRRKGFGTETCNASSEANLKNNGPSDDSQDWYLYIILVNE
jgi:hypothetical protein